MYYLYIAFTFKALSDYMAFITIKLPIFGADIFFW